MLIIEGKENTVFDENTQSKLNDPDTSDFFNR